MKPRDRSATGERVAVCLLVQTLYLPVIKATTGRDQWETITAPMVTKNTGLRKNVKGVTPMSDMTILKWEIFILGVILIIQALRIWLSPGRCKKCGGKLYAYDDKRWFCEDCETEAT